MVLMRFSLSYREMVGGVRLIFRVEMVLPDAPFLTRSTIQTPRICMGILDFFRGGRMEKMRASPLVLGFARLGERRLHASSNFDQHTKTPSAKICQELSVASIMQGLQCHSSSSKFYKNARRIAILKHTLLN